MSARTADRRKAMRRQRTRVTRPPAPGHQRGICPACLSLDTIIRNSTRTPVTAR